MAFLNAFLTPLLAALPNVRGKSNEPTKSGYNDFVKSSKRVQACVSRCETCSLCY